MIKAVLFDLDGTLYDRDRLAAELFAQQYEGRSPGRIDRGMEARALLAACCA
jgi:FMN phosphatase YigB (HAD superfamily)